MSCPTCDAALRAALSVAAACRVPVGERVVGPFEAAAWRRLQASSEREMAAALLRAGACRDAG